MHLCFTPRSFFRPFQCQFSADISSARLCRALVSSIYLYLYLRSGGAESWCTGPPRDRVLPSSITGPPPRGGPVGSPGAQGGFPWGPKSAFGGLFDLVYIYIYIYLSINILGPLVPPGIRSHSSAFQLPHPAGSGYWPPNIAFEPPSFHFQLQGSDFWLPSSTSSAIWFSVLCRHRFLRVFSWIWVDFGGEFGIDF